MYSHAEIIKKPKLQCSQGKAFLPCLHNNLKELNQMKNPSSPANKQNFK